MHDEQVQFVTRVAARNFRSLKQVDVPLGRFSVLAGPNGSGKSNVLNVLRFLATTARLDLSAALDQWSGFDHIQRQDGSDGEVKIQVHGQITRYSSPNALDEYELSIRQGKRGILRTEEFEFKRRSGPGRRYRAVGETVSITENERSVQDVRVASAQTTGLATLPKLADDQGGLGIRDLADFLAEIRVLEPDVEAARQPSRRGNGRLFGDASNLADALVTLRQKSPDAFGQLLSDLRLCLPGLADIGFRSVGGATGAQAVELHERGVRRPIDLADASFGTVRMLALLTALHEPDPPAFTAIEEVDHGLHPYALDVLVDRMRAASSRTQLLVATHSPTFLNRLAPQEIIVCDRDPRTGDSLIPALRALFTWLGGRTRG
ncbi:AAA family ATPase [Luteimicrobium xylanilyticum]|uniref:ATPase AAA-type core domain-containing protein n=1 Tax=Luteimicrobium xylanilyticum TaxID=1133546 RepID=A0A5P9QAQ1_9MICO|nr:AAA family ATPase [Luteimicrobium xylanilyticum]QFU98507.1 hypothetical protein KDY119_02023 [Luteimicrobium xylanilyticum]